METDMGKMPELSLVDEILATIWQEVEECRKFKLYSDNIKRFEEANYIYNMVKELITVRREQFAQIKDKHNLTLTEAILHARHVQVDSDLCVECKADHGQLADWLQELKNFRRATEGIDNLKEV